MGNGTVRHLLSRGLRRWTALLVYLVPASVAAQAISDIRIDTPRDFGYTIGDTIRHEMYLSLSDPYRLDTTTLPKTGRLNRWLEISRAESNVEYRGQIAVYRITVDYQIFNAPQQLAAVTIPQQEFLTAGGPIRIPVSIPEWTFSIGPITNSDARQSLQLRPDRQPQAIPVFGRRIRLMISTLLLTGLLIYLVYRRFLLPRLNRDRYPFFHALKELRNLRRTEPGPERCRLGLQAVHAAVNATAGQVIFAGNLHEFILANSKYTALSTELSSFYARSEDVFFNNSEVENPGTLLRDLVALCRHCRALERSAA